MQHHKQLLGQNTSEQSYPLFYTSATVNKTYIVPQYSFGTDFDAGGC